MICGTKFIGGMLVVLLLSDGQKCGGGGLETYRHLNFYKKKPMDDIIRLVFPCCCVFFFPSSLLISFQSSLFCEP